MRSWRKVYSSVITSDRLANVGDAAFRLYVYLLVAQDDAGRYPWTRTNRRSLVIGTTWTDDDTQAHAASLIGAGLCEMADGWIVIVGGAEKNGNLRPDRAPFQYTDVPVVDEPVSAPAKRSKHKPVAPTLSTWAITVNGVAHDDPLSGKNIEQITAKYGALDLDEEALKFADYWERKGRPSGNWSTYRRLLTWLGKALADHDNRPSRQSVNTQVDTGFYPDQIHKFQGPCSCPRCKAASA